MTDSPIYGINGINKNAPVYGDGGIDSGAIIYGGYGDKHATRKIPNFTGTQYGTLDTAIVASAGDTLEIKVSTTVTGATLVLVDGDIATSRGLFYFSGGNTIVWDASFVLSGTLDGVAIVSGVTPAPADGKIHDIIITYKTGARFGTIGANYTGGQNFQGQILSTKFTDKSGAEDVITNFVLDSGSTVEQYSRDGLNKITWTGFTSANWSRYTLQRNIIHDAGTIAEGWVGDNVVVNGRFDADTDWVKGAGITIASGVCSFVSVATALQASQSSIINDNLPYLISVEVKALSLGGFIMKAGATNGATRSAVGVYTEIIISSSTYVAVRALGTTTGDIDNISAKHLLEVV